MIISILKFQLEENQRSAPDGEIILSKEGFHGKARLKWSIYYAEREGSKVRVKRSADKRGEGIMTPERIKAQILPYLGVWGIQLPIVIKTYYSVKPSGLATTMRGGKPAFTPASPKMDTEEYSFYIDGDQTIFEIVNEMEIQQINS